MAMICNNTTPLAVNLKKLIFRKLSLKSFRCLTRFAFSILRVSNKSCEALLRRNRQGYFVARKRRLYATERSNTWSKSKQAIKHLMCAIYQQSGFGWDILTNTLPE